MLMDQIYDEKNNDEVWTEHAALSEAMTRLGERERKILFLRYYEGKTQTEISDEPGISQAQVSRLEKNAISSIRSNIACDFWIISGVWCNQTLFSLSCFVEIS